jgi:hypothetical protein
MTKKMQVYIRMDLGPGGSGPFLCKLPLIPHSLLHSESISGNKKRPMQVNSTAPGIYYGNRIGLFRCGILVAASAHGAMAAITSTGGLSAFLISYQLSYYQHCN